MDTTKNRIPYGYLEEHEKELFCAEALEAGMYEVRLKKAWGETKGMYEEHFVGFKSSYAYRLRILPDGLYFRQFQGNSRGDLVKGSTLHTPFSSPYEVIRLATAEEIVLYTAEHCGEKVEEKLGHLSKSEVTAAFVGTNFGNAQPIPLLAKGVLKQQAGYCSGYTLTTIMQELGLVSYKGKVTDKGRRFLFLAYEYVSVSEELKEGQ